jgi:methionyl-tRNA formyltransferase
MSLDLVYFSGGPRERVLDAIISAGHHVRHVFVNDPARWPKILPTIALAERLGLPVTVLKRKADVTSALTICRDQLCFSAGFAYLFPTEFLSAVSACLNVHGSLLPKYAGARTLSWAIESGENESGVTVHRVDEGMDTGPILLQRSFRLSQFETTRSLARKTGDLEPSVVVDALALWEREGAAALRCQDGHPPTLPNRVPAHSQIDPNRRLVDLFDAIRAADPDHYPAHFYVDGQKVCIRLWRPDKTTDETDLI